MPVYFCKRILLLFRESLFLQEAEDERTAFAKQNSFELIRPGGVFRVGRAMLVIVPHLLIVGFQFRRIGFLIGVFAERDGSGEPGFQFILMRRVPEREADHREGILRKLKETVHFLNMIPDAARVNPAESQGFKRGKGVLSLNRGIHATHNQLLGPAEIRLRHEDRGDNPRRTPRIRAPR